MINREENGGILMDTAIFTPVVSIWVLTS